MKGFLLRSVSLFMIGFLLVLNPDTPVLIVRVVAVLFVFFGLLSLLHYMRARCSKLDVVKPLFPLTGVGSIGLGILLGLYPERFIAVLMYLLGAVIVLFGMNQLSSIVLYRRIAPMRWWAFVMPVAVTVAGIVVLVHPLESAAMPFVVIGCCCIFHGISELFYGLRLSACRRKRAKAEEIEDAEIVEEMPATPQVDDPDHTEGE